MVGIQYIFNTILVYGLLFSLFYFEINYRPFFYNKKYTSHSYIRHGIMLGLMGVFIFILLDILGIRNAADGRFVILILAVLMYNFYTGIIAALCLNAYIIFTNPNAIIETLLTTLLTIFVVEVYKSRFMKSKHQYMALAALTTSLGLVNLLIGVMIAPLNPYVKAIEMNLVPSIIMFAVVTNASYYLISSQRLTDHRLKTLYKLTEDLETQNEEIKTLYDNVRIAESNLKKNYEILDDYRWRLETSDKRYERVLDASSEGFFDYYPITRVWVLSKRFCDLLGYSYEHSDALSRELFDHIPLAHKYIKGYFEDAALWPENRMISTELELATKEGYLRWYVINAIADVDEEGRITRITGSLLDIHLRKIEQEKVEFYAFHDPITGFLNADYFYEMMKKRLDSGKLPFKVFYVAIARYDKLLEVYGKNILDVVQYQLGNEVNQQFGDYAEFSVMGQGTFAILVKHPEKHEKDIEVGISRINQKFEKAVRITNVDVRCSIMYPYYICREDEDVKVIVDRLEETKSYCEDHNFYGKFKAFDWDYFNLKTFRKELSVYLRTCLDKEHFSVHYQPQIIYENGIFKIDGFEALVRLNHPQYGRISPDTFIELAENLGEIHKIDAMVLDKVIAFSRHLKSEKVKHYKIAINLSYIDLLNTDHIEKIIERIKACRQEGIVIAIEITESAIAKYIEEVRENLDRISKASIEIHLDDFGTGYSSLSQLADLPINALKIDRSFIHQMMSNEKVASLVEMTINLGRQMHLEVIAEGIETELQLKKLIQMKCYKFQGYYFSEPLNGNGAQNFILQGIDDYLYDKNNQ